MFHVAEIVFVIVVVVDAQKIVELFINPVAVKQRRTMFAGVTIHTTRRENQSFESDTIRAVGATSLFLIIAQGTVYG